MTDTTHQSLPTRSTEQVASDFAKLRAEGLRYIASLAGDTWSDHNVHDPGITILEQLCYALTDLSYRIEHSMPDLLASGHGQGASFPTPASILTCNPVTPDDLRRLVLDVEGVRNAWVEPFENPIPIFHHEGAAELRLQAERHGTKPISLRGLNRVLVEKWDRVDATSVRRAVAQRVHAHRSLGEDYEVQVLETQPVVVNARVEIGPVDDVEGTLQRIYGSIGDYLSPMVPFATLDEMLAAGHPLDEIFEGPALSRGFITDAALAQAPRRTRVYASDLIHVLMEEPAVRAVRGVSLSTPGGAPQAWELKIPAGRVPALDFDQPGITLYRAGLRVATNNTSMGRATFRRQSPVLSSAERDVKPPQGRDRHVGDYRSIQHQFPALYGIGAMGLPRSAPPARHAQANQLRAYLFFFEQLLANLFAQLEYFPSLFSFEGDTLTTYAPAHLEDPDLGLEPLLTDGTAGFRRWLGQNTESTAHAHGQGHGERRNRFLNHLLARFGEALTDYALVLGDGAKRGSPEAQAALARDKQAFLRHFPRISSARGSGVNYLEPESRSGLEERIHLKLGLPLETRRSFYVVEHILLRPLPEDARQLGPEGEPQVPFLRRSPFPDPYSLQLSFVFRASTVPGNEEEHGVFRQFAEQTIREETPAHLTPYVQWLDETGWVAFEEAYVDWVARHQSYWRSHFGV